MFKKSLERCSRICINVNNVHSNGDTVMLNTIVTELRLLREIAGGRK